MPVYRCITPFATRVDGVRRVVAAGELVNDNDPVFTADRKGLFEPVQAYVDRIADKRVTSVTAVETATAAPGELRTVTQPPTKRTAAKKTAPKKTGETADTKKEEES